MAKKTERELALRAAIIVACAEGNTKWPQIQRACNLVAESMFGDIGKQGTTIPAFPIAMQLVSERIIVMTVDSDDNALYSLAKRGLQLKRDATVQEKNDIAIDSSLTLFSVSIDNQSRDAVDAMLIWARDRRHAREIAAGYEHIPERDQSKWLAATCVSPCSPIAEVLVAYKTKHLPENK